MSYRKDEISQHMKCNVFEIDKGEILTWIFSLYLLKIFFVASCNNADEESACSVPRERLRSLSTSET